MRQYRLLEITVQYDQYLREFYTLHKDFDKWSYDELYAALVEDAFAESDFIHRELNKMGIQSKAVFCNNRNLQKKWKGFTKDMSYFDILLSQIKDFKPDIILVSDVSQFSREETKMIRDCLAPKVIKLVGYHFTGLNDVFREHAPLYDQIYTGSRAFVNSMNSYGLPAYLLRHAFAPSILEQVPACERKNEICFLGSVIVSETIHNNRVQMFSQLIKEKIPYDFYGNIYGSLQETNLSGDDREMMDIAAEITKSVKPGAFGLKYYEIMNQYNVCLNLHAICAGSHGAGNMRMFEATGMGTCLLTDSRDENAELFNIDKEIVVYESFEDMVEKAGWLIDHPKEGKEIALAGQKRTLKDYTYRNKAECLNEYLQMLLV